jgi:putative CocE/NonD family hydrolase
MQIVDKATGTLGFQTYVDMRDGVKLNTFVFLPAEGGRQFPVILHRTPYGITTPPGQAVTDPAHGWLPSAAEPMRGSMLRGWKAIVARGYATVYQDTRGRYASEGEDRVYADDAADGYDTLAWIADQPWTNQRVGMSGSSAGATTTLAAASTRHPSLRAFFAQVGGSSIYDDVVYEGQSIEMERLWLWVAKNIPGLSSSHKEAVMRQSGATETMMEAAHTSAGACYDQLEAASHAALPFIHSEDWMRLPLTNHPDFTTWQPFLNELITHPAPDAFRAAHNFRRTIDIPGFHATTWYDIFLTSVMAAFQDIQARTGTQKLWIGPNAHHFIYQTNFWPRDPYFEWFGHYLKDEKSDLIDEPAVCYAPRAWVEDAGHYVPDDWRHADSWPPAGVATQRLYLTGDGGLGETPGGDQRTYVYDPRTPNPTLGGRNMLIIAGQVDQRPAQALRHYGLMYTGDTLDGDLTVAGEGRVTLHVGSDCPDTDFIAKLIEVMPDGRRLLLMDGVTRAMYRASILDPAHNQPQPLAPRHVYTVTIGLGAIHHTVRAGSRLQVDIVSSNFPRRARNTNSGHPVVANDSEADIRVATNTVYHTAATPSWVEMSVLPG